MGPASQNIQARPSPILWVAKPGGGSPVTPDAFVLVDEDGNPLTDENNNVLTTDGN